MHLFISAGEPSGDLHGANLIRALKRIDPSAKCVGFGGERMEAAGCRLLYPLTKLALMWFLRVLLNIFTFIGLLKKARRYFREQRPDAVIVIDFPGFHWHLAKWAKADGIPVFYFVPPQLWGWGGWRIRKMKRTVEHVLAALPFENDWYHARNMPSTYIGHPYFDELAEKVADASFLSEQRLRTGNSIAILPGSRKQEVIRNLADMLDAAAMIHKERPDTRFLVASFDEPQAEIARRMIARVNVPIEVHVGRTPEIVEISEMCISVSGSVSLEMMYHLKPAVIVYRVGSLFLRLSKSLRKCKYITLVNLLADKEIFPEFVTDRSPAKGVAANILEWLNHPKKANEVRQSLREMRDRAAAPGACDRAAAFILERIGQRAELPERAA